MGKKKYAARLVKRLKAFAESNDMRLPPEHEIEAWAYSAGGYDGDGDGPNAKTSLYNLVVSPESRSLAKDIGKVDICMREVCLNGYISPYIVLTYHGAHNYIPAPYLDRYEAKSLGAAINAGIEFEKFGVMNVYPILDMDDVLVSKLAEDGKMEVKEISSGSLKGKRSAHIILPDDMFHRLADPLFYTYLGQAAATLINTSVLNEEPDETVFMKAFGEKEYDALFRHIHTVCAHAVRCTKIVEDTRGIALVDFGNMSTDEADFVMEISRKRGMDVSEYCLRKGFGDVFNVLKKLLSKRTPEDQRKKNAKRFAGMLNNYAPMRFAREKAGIGEFNAFGLMCIIGDGAEAADNRRKKLTEEYLLQIKKTDEIERNGI